jgi:hypothetical protein
MVQVYLVPHTKFEPGQFPHFDAMRNIQYSCGCARLNNEVVTICTQHDLKDLERAKNPEELNSSLAEFPKKETK